MGYFSLISEIQNSEHKVQIRMVGESTSMKANRLVGKTTKLYLKTIKVPTHSPLEKKGHQY